VTAAKDDDEAKTTLEPMWVVFTKHGRNEERQENSLLTARR